MSDVAIKLREVNKSFKAVSEAAGKVKDYFTNPLKLFNTTGRRFIALDSINLEVKKGETIAIVGRNGSGKSTLLKIMAGVFVPDKGEVLTDGKIVPFLELGVGFSPELTARENIYLNGTILGMSKKYIDSKFDEIVSFAEIEEFVDTQVKNFSSGMYVRLAFAIAIQADGDIYILDEILAVGDGAFQNKSARILKRLAKSDKTIILVTHDMGAVNEYCSRAILIENHKIIADDKPLIVTNIYNKLLTDSLNSKQTVDKIIEVPKDKNKILEVKIIDELGRPVEYINRAQAFAIEVDIHVALVDEDMYVGIGVLDNQNDTWIIAQNTSVDEFTHDWVIGTNKIILNIRPNIFNKGEFYILVSLFKKEPGLQNNYDFYDSRDHNKYLKIANYDRRNGLVIMAHEWVHGENSKKINIDNIKNK